MSSIPNSEAQPVAAHSHNPDEEIGDEVESDNRTPIHECFLVKLNRILHQKRVPLRNF